MSLAEAQQIALQSDCMQVGRLKDTAVYNPNSNTWWIDLDATARGCNPACVVDVATKTAEVNWRCTGAAVPPQIMTPTSSQSANPASENCIKQGGTLSIQTRGDDGQYGVCMFEDNKQCEEWAMLHGDCPVGGIKVTGYVDDLRPYLEESALMVVPVRAGGGMRVRILEAFAYAMPVVTTTVGLEGIHGTPDHDVIVADTPSDFANRTAELLENASLQERLSTNGRELAIKKYDWQAVLSAMRPIYE